MARACSLYGESRVVYRVMVVQPVERDHVENPGVYGRKILRRILRNWDVRHKLDRSGTGYGQVACSCECDNELSGSIKCREFLD